jgi:hypothetical protein
MPTTLNLYLIRHGQTEYNAAGIVQGWCDSPLTAEGKAGAAQTGNAIAQAQIRFAAAYCSTSPRTAATTQIILQHAQQPHTTPTPLDDLREYHFGSFEGQPSSHIHQTIAQELGYERTEDWLADYRSGKHSNNQLMHTLHRIDPRAEQESQFIQRLHRGIQHIIANSLARSAQGSLKTESSGEIPTPNVLIVSHGMAITALLRSINPQAIPYRSVPNASATLLRYNLIGGLQIISEAGKALPLP